MKGALDIFRFFLDAAGRGERTALVTITDVIVEAYRSSYSKDRSAGSQQRQEHLTKGERRLTCRAISTPTQHFQSGSGK